LIGFTVVTSEYRELRAYREDGTRNIRSICPIYDEIDCAGTFIVRDEFRDMEALIPGPADTQTLYIDFMSMHYGSLDGYSFCQDTF
jgi:hypothetical protein